MHGSRRWRGDARLHYADLRARREKDRHDRRDRRNAAGQRAANGLVESERCPMRLLPVRADHVGGGTAGDDRQHLPLRHVSANPRSDQAGCCGTGEEGMSAQMIQRRTFLAGLSGLVLVASVSRIAKAADAAKYGADGMPHGWRDDPLTFVAIGEDGLVTVVVHRSEMGQGIRTGLPIVIADELEADWSK